MALLAWECQTWDAAEDVVYDSLTPAEAALVNSLPHQWAGVTSFRVALGMATMETILFATTMFISMISASILVTYCKFADKHNSKKTSHPIDDRRISRLEAVRSDKRTQQADAY